jgi:hypothetical protein
VKKACLSRKAVQGLIETANESGTDGAAGKVNPIQSSVDSGEDSGSSTESESQEMLN